MKKWQRNFIIAIIVPLMIFGGLILYGAYSSKEVSAQRACSGKYNIQTSGSGLPTYTNTTIANGSNIWEQVIILPEKELYQKFEITSARAIFSCNSGDICTFYVNSNACLTGIESGSKLRQLDCLELFHEGVNTVRLSEQPLGIKWLFFETYMTSARC